MNNHAELYKYTIAAGAQQVVYATGNKVFVRTALQPFIIKFDTGSSVELEDGYRFTSDKTFSRLQIQNNNSSALYVEFYVSDATVERDSPQYSREALTAINPLTSFTFSLAAGVTTGDIAASPLGKHRKEVVIGNQNSAAGSNLQIWVNGNAVAFVPPASSYVLPTNDTFQIKNISGVAITVYVMEIIYV